jgi:hypothetical protein
VVVGLFEEFLVFLHVGHAFLNLLAVPSERFQCLLLFLCLAFELLEFAEVDHQLVLLNALLELLYGQLLLGQGLVGLGVGQECL